MFNNNNLFNLKQKYEQECDEKIDYIKEQIVPYQEVYNEQLTYIKNKLREELKIDKHKITITTNSVTEIHEFNNLKEAKEYYEDLLFKWKKEIYIELDNLTIGTNGIISIGFKEGLHPEKYTDEEINQLAEERLKKQMNNWYVVKPKPQYTLLGKQYIYRLIEKDDMYF
jgi:hypothetical protein